MLLEESALDNNKILKWHLPLFYSTIGKMVKSNKPSWYVLWVRSEQSLRGRNQRFWGETGKTGIITLQGVFRKREFMSVRRETRGLHLQTLPSPAPHSLGWASSSAWQETGDLRQCYERTENPHHTKPSFISTCLEEEPTFGVAVLYVIVREKTKKHLAY